MINRILKVFFLLALIVISNYGYAKLVYTKNIETAHLLILNFKSKKAEAILQEERIKDPKNVYIDYLLSYQFFLDSYFKVEDKCYNTFLKDSESCIELLKNEKNSEKSSVLIATLHIQRAFIYFLWSEHLSYVNELIKGRSILDKIGEETNNIEYLKIRSLYELTGGSVPRKFKTLASWFGIKGESKKSIELIDKYTSLVKDESANGIEGEIIKLYIYNFLDLDSKAIKSSSFKCPLLAYTYIQSSSISAQKKISIIENLKPPLTPYFSYLKAKSLLEMQKEEGLTEMDIFLKNHKGNSLKHSANFIKYKYFIAQEMHNNAEHEKQIIEKLSEAQFPKDKAAVEGIEKDYNSYLLQARMLFDAQDYKKSLIILNSNKNRYKTTKDLLEYKYRLARINEKTQNISSAISLFKEVIDSEESEYYFVSYSAYRMGKIYIDLNNKELAKKYFEIALELNQGEYQISIENKCLFAIMRL